MIREIEVVWLVGGGGGQRKTGETGKRACVGIVVHYVMWCVVHFHVPEGRHEQYRGILGVFFLYLKSSKSSIFLFVRYRGIK